MTDTFNPAEIEQMDVEFEECQVCDGCGYTWNGIEVHRCVACAETGMVVKEGEKMERLTARSPKNGQAYLLGVKPDEQAVDGSYNTLKCIMEAFNRLAEYEELDLESEVNRLQVALQATIEEKERCRKLAVKYSLLSDEYKIRLERCENMKLAREFEELLQTTSIPVAVEKVRNLIAVAEAAGRCNIITSAGEKIIRQAYLEAQAKEAIK